MREVVRRNEQVNDEYCTLPRLLISCMREDPLTISTVLDALFVAKAIERIGNHAKDMPEYVV